MVILRNIEENDLEMIMHWRMLPEITKYMYTDPVLTIESQRLWYERTKMDERNKHFVIEVDGMPAGILNIEDIDLKNKKCSWGYYVAVQEKRSLQLALSLECNVYDYAFDELKLNKVTGEVFSFNKAVIRMHQMCGSVIEGERKAHICKNGEFFDVTELGICVEDWNVKKEKMRYEKIEFIDRKE